MDVLINPLPADIPALCVFIIVTTWMSDVHGLPSYEYNCSGTFEQESSTIRVTDWHQAACDWRFETRPGEVFQITFLHFNINPEEANCNRHHVAVRVGHARTQHCGNVRAPYVVNLSSNVVRISYWKFDETDHFTFRAAITTNVKSQFWLIDTPLTWSEAAAACKEREGNLAISYPVVSKQLETFVEQAVSAVQVQDRITTEYWIGKSLTKWTTLLGCVRVNEGANGYLAYQTSKYNQMSECAGACSGYTYFLLQEHSCQCLNETLFEYVPYIKCKNSCPGSNLEKCGGFNVHTLYSFDTNGTVSGEGTHLCVTLQGDLHRRIQTSCNTKIGFSCKLLNGTVRTFNPNINPEEKQNEELGFHQAVDYCAKLTGGLGMAPVPIYHYPYMNEFYWTTTTRAIDWNFDSAIDRDPEFSTVATINSAGRYSEYTRNSSEKRGVICQKEYVTCGNNEVSDSGNLTSPDYPAVYRHNQLCKWSITVNEGKVVRLLIQQMDLEASRGCCYDYLLVEGGSSPGTRYCGQLTMKELIVRNTSVTVVFRTDDTSNGKGFFLTWTAVDPYTEPVSDKDLSSREKKSISGGAVAGITFAVATVLVALAALLACVAYRRRHPRPEVSDKDESSTAHNAIYAVSSFDTSVVPAEERNTCQYIHSQSTKTNLKAEISYANDPSKVKESSPNVYQTIPFYSDGNNGDGNQIEGSKANLLFDSDSSNFGSVDGGILAFQSKYSIGNKGEAAGAAIGAGSAQQLDNISMSEIEDLGKDCINVTRVETAAQRGIQGNEGTYITNSMPSTKYKENAFTGKSTGQFSSQSADERPEDVYLNEGLSSNTHAPHYDDIPDTGNVQYVQIDHSRENTAVQGGADHLYMEL